MTPKWVAGLVNQLELGEVAPRQAEAKIRAASLSPSEKRQLGQAIMSIANRARRAPYDHLLRLYRLAYGLDPSAEPSEGLRSKLGAANVRPVAPKMARASHSPSRAERVAAHLAMSHEDSEKLLAELARRAGKRYRTETIVPATPNGERLGAAKLLERIRRREELKLQHGWKPSRLQTYTIGERQRRKLR